MVVGLLRAADAITRVGIAVLAILAMWHRLLMILCDPKGKEEKKENLAYLMERAETVQVVLVLANLTTNHLRRHLLHQQLDVKVAPVPMNPHRFQPKSLPSF